MALFGRPHPDCGATIVGVPRLQGAGDLVVSHPGCDWPDGRQETVYDHTFTPAQAVADAQRLIDRHRTRGWRGW